VAAWGLLSGALLVAAPVAAQLREPPPAREAVQYSFALVPMAAPAVVNVYVRARVPTFVSPFADDPLFRRFFGERFGMPQERIQNSLGSGVIVAPGEIVMILGRFPIPWQIERDASLAFWCLWSRA
jgi:serine protease Do